jgi:hypothetical protein
LKEVARHSMRRTVLFTVHELQQGLLESWALTSRRMPTARAIKLAVVHRSLHGGNDEDADRTGPFALYRDASRVRGLSPRTRTW